MKDRQNYKQSDGAGKMGEEMRCSELSQENTIRVYMQAYEVSNG